MIHRLVCGIFLVVGALFISCCSQSSENGTGAVPLPKAWPRIALTTSDTMVSVPGTPVSVQINPAASWLMEETDPPGLTVTYPGAGMRIYYTFIIPENQLSRERILDLRRQRISLNLNGLSAKTIHGNSASGGEAVVVVAESGAQTPVQLLASLPECIVSATAFIENPSASLNYDSIYPLIKIVEHDLLKTLPGLNWER